MQRVIINTQSYIMGDAIKNALVSHGDISVTVAEKPDEVAGKCYSIAATAVILEVTGYTPWKLEERMKIRDEIKKSCPNCKIVFLVDENAEKEAAEKIKRAKADDLIDLFLYASTSASYLSALIETL